MIRAGVIAMLAAGPAIAGPDCYQRFYSDAHMAANPTQGVQGLVLHFHPIEGGTRGVQLWAELTPEMESLASETLGQRYYSDMRCEAAGPDVEGADPAAETCFDLCDLGFIQIVEESDSRLLIRSFGLGLHGNSTTCSGGAVLADRGETSGYVVTTFRLDGAAEADCEG
ncbi:hypothetical protein FHY55_13580 [Oceanicola sp. D3]|uniref:hypothetical protein n=1 Tax=Oceanicola sp. D3 TaxID=2587163 RepID=UPI00111FA7C3|nr:hypothetical protein [Oceanicola sp. D3]QDC10215.1 hypothetical protein FHY55_13580 [Oceanicola sp. D3]